MDNDTEISIDSYDNISLHDASQAKIKGTCVSEEVPLVKTKLMLNINEKDDAPTVYEKKGLNFDLYHVNIIEDSFGNITKRFNNFAYQFLNKLLEAEKCCELCQSDIEKLTKDKQRTLAGQEAYQVHIESLEKSNEEKSKELNRIREEFEQKSYSLQRTIIDLEQKLTNITNKCEVLNNEKDTMVMKYAVSEQGVILVKKEKERLEKKIREVEKERDLYQHRIKDLQKEKDTLTKSLENKKNKLLASSKEIEKCEKELSCQNIKTKWIEDNYNNELAKYKKQEQELFEKIQELEKQTVKNNENISTHEINEKVEAELRAKQKELIDENNGLSLKIQKLERERFSYEDNLMQLKQSLEKENEKVSELQNRTREMDALKTCLKQQEDKLADYQLDVERLREINNDLRSDMEIYREKEADLLIFTEKLTAKNVTLQSEFTSLEAKNIQLDKENTSLENRIKELQEEMLGMKKKLKEETENRGRDNKLLMRQLLDKTEEVEKLRKQIEELKGEMESLKHKYASGIRELNREIQLLQKKQEGGSNTDSNSNSKTGSTDSNLNSVLCTSKISNGTEIPVKLQPDKQPLIEKIVKLQHINASYIEKIDFLEEHISQLVLQIKKKTKILQSYILREQAGALSSELMDTNKAEVSKHGGIMASLYNSKLADDSLTLDLSMEINRKLQAVLEDTLLKNITLKDNIETLGKEIAKLSKTSSVG